MERYPVGTTIYVPTKNKDEIIEKLKKNSDIASIAGKLTAKGEEVNDELRSSFEFN